MKNIFVLLLLGILVSSCNAYQDALKSDDIKLKYEMADSLYSEALTVKRNGKKKTKLKKALKLWEQIVPVYRGRPQAERVMYMYSDTYYLLGDYYLSGYQFERFVNAYPQSEKRETAAFKSAASYYHLSPRFNLDQVDTEKAMVKLQAFVNNYPESERIEEINVMVKELRTKIERKAFETAKQYNKIAVSQFTYPAAIKSFDNFLSDYPGSVYREEAMYWKLNSAYNYAIGSRDDLVLDRLRTAKKAHETLVKYYPQGKFDEEATEIINDINERLEGSTIK